jgi:hypothetical protein
MKFSYPFLLLVISVSSFAQAETWTSTDGRTLEGEFVRYDFETGVITIRRTPDYQTFDIPEDKLVHSDKLRAALRGSREDKPYWTNDYSKTLARKTRKRFLFFYCNNSDPESFELYCYKLLLDPEFMAFVSSYHLTVCVQQSLPEDWGFRGGTAITQEELNKMTPNIPTLIYANSKGDDKNNPDFLLGVMPLKHPSSPFADPFAPETDSPTEFEFIKVSQLKEQLADKPEW